jgi:hypothetical protein
MVYAGACDRGLVLLGDKSQAMELYPFVGGLLDTGAAPDSFSESILTPFHFFYQLRDTTPSHSSAAVSQLVPRQSPLDSRAPRGLQPFCNCGNLTTIRAMKVHKGARADDWCDRPARQDENMLIPTTIMSSEIVQRTPRRVAESERTANATIGGSLALR